MDDHNPRHDDYTPPNLPSEPVKTPAKGDFLGAEMKSRGALVKQREEVDAFFASVCDCAMCLAGDE